MSEQKSVRVEKDPYDIQLSVWRKLGYSCGGFANNILLGIAAGFQMFFMTDVARIPAGILSVTGLLTRIFDAVIDPPIGALADRTKSRWGRYRPWILFSFPLLLIAQVLLFTVLPGQRTEDGYANVTQIIWTTVFGVLYALLYSAHDVPYSAMPAALTTNYNSRGSTGAWRLFFGNIGMILAINQFMNISNGLGGGSPERGYMMAALVLSIISVPFFITAFVSTKEVVPLQPQQAKVPLRNYYKCIKGNTPLIMMCLAYVFWGMYGNVNGASRMYFFTYILKNQEAFSTTATFQTVGYTVGAFGVNYVLKYFRNKRTPSMIAWFCGGVILIIMSFINLTNDLLWLWNILTFLYGVCGMAGLTSIFSCTPDLTEYTQRKYGITASSFIFSVVNLSFGIAGSLAGSAFTALLGGLGYVPGEEMNSAVRALVHSSYTWVTGLFLVLAAVCLYFYRLDRDSHKENIAAVEGIIESE